MKHLLFEEIVAINQYVTQIGGEDHFYESEDERKLRDILEKARRIGRGLPRREFVKRGCLSHAHDCIPTTFHEGNKRTAYVSCQTLLVINGHSLKASDQEVFNHLEGIARYQTIGLNETELFVKSHLV